LKKVHFIAIGGAIMHNLALALRQKGYQVSGSDDVIYDPAKSRLDKAGLLPKKEGWFAENITAVLDFVILGMHAKADNPELQRALELGLKVMSFPEFIAEETKDKIRIVVAGSHGKTSTTAMIIHALTQANMDIDFVVGSSIAGYDLSVRLSDAPIVVIEGDEYLTSPLDLRSKFLWYHPHISIITGIAWDHINVFPTYESYLDTFRLFIESHTADDSIIYFEEDQELQQLVRQHAESQSVPYNTPAFELQDHQYVILYDGQKFPLSIIGRHNLQNLQAAYLACEKVGLSQAAFYGFMEHFTGAGTRLEKIYETENQIVFRDFAHSPSKAKATIQAALHSYSKRKWLMVFELYTFSSLKKEFLPLYSGVFDQVENAIVYLDEDTLKKKSDFEVSENLIASSFGKVQFVTNKEALHTIINNSFYAQESILLMSSGKLGGYSLPVLA
jgi:UDP-N-acetylmuramate: L-alanyl-gamma-D-glutamyl-meso-diaminopimelate ligase